jgi:ABC-type branched-subunit amino acid transport system substrate-binding protein
MFARAMEYWGVETADIFYFDPTTTDFSSIMINILALEPDFIHLGGAPATQAAAAIKAARELGYTGMMGCIGDGSQSLPAFVDLAGGAANVAGYVAGSNGGPVDESSFTPAMLEWKERYEETYNEPFNPTTMDWSMGAFTLVDGIRAAKSLEPEDIAEALRSPDFVGENLWGEYTYGMKEIYGLDQNIVCPISYFQYGDDGVPHDVLIAYPDEYMPIAIQMNLGGENISWK